jgi:hypothetical protein
MRIQHCGVALFFLSVGCASVPPRHGATPAVEMAVGFNLAQLPEAEFPGLAGSLVLNRSWTSQYGVALVAEGDSSYLMPSVAAGARIFGRSGPLFTENRALTYFGQVLVGAVAGQVQGVLQSQGGLMVQPGVGFDYGAGYGGFHMQVDYRVVPDGVIDDARQPGKHIDRLSGPRLVLGMMWRFRAR